MITRAKWTYTLVNLGRRMVKAKTKYGWDKPISEPNTIRECTCVGFIASALQELKLLPEGDYIHMENGKLLGPGWDDIKKHPEKFEIIHVNASPQKLGASLQVGDICLYNTPHIMVYAGRNKAGTPIWYSLERGSGGMGKPAKLTLAAVFSYYSKRKIDYVVRLKFADAAKKPAAKKPTTTTAAKKPEPIRWKLKTAMNMRDKANGDKIICRIPQGAVLTQQSKTGYWIKTTYCGATGWVCCATDKYASKV